MGKGHILVGLEIGTSKVCVAVAEVKASGDFTILGIGQAPSRGVRKGEIVDFETASKCVREALVDAEEKSDVMIESVYVGVTGSHISSFNNRGVVSIPEDKEEIDEEDIEDVKAKACEVNLPQQNAFLHSIIQHYYVDDRDGVLNPIGFLGHKLEADFHIIHGIRTRIQNSIRCVKEIGLQVEDVVMNALASAQVVVTPQKKSSGALVIDIGGGVTDYIVYADGAVKMSGVLAVGGDHVTNDISMGLRIPMNRAEKLKLEEGSVALGQSAPVEMITLKDDFGFAGKSVERETLNTILHLRFREIFELLQKRIEAEHHLSRLGAGVFITGGCSQIKGLKELAEDVFGVPVQMSRVQSMSGPTSAFENPQFSTAIGLVKYAQALMLDRPARSALGSIIDIFKKPFRRK